MIHYFSTVGTRTVIVCLLACSLLACSRKVTETGKASFYANKFNGRKTASGERFRNSALTAAHKTLPFGTTVKVTNVKNGKSVKVRINDRGPFVAGRIVDLSSRAARTIDMHKEGVGTVKVQYKKKKKRKK